MEQYIPKSAVVAEIEKLIDKIYTGRPFDSLSSEQQTALWYVKSIMSFINNFEVKEVDLEHLEQEVKDFCYKFDNRKDKWYNMTPRDKSIITNPTWSNFTMQLAKHFFELGLNANNPLTWEDMRIIAEIGDKFMNSEESDNLSEEDYYKEILKRFKARGGE